MLFSTPIMMIMFFCFYFYFLSMKHFNNIPEKVRKKEFQSPWAHSQRYSGPLSHSPGRQPPRCECLLFLGQRWGDDEVLERVPYQVHLERAVQAQVSLLCVILFPRVTGGDEATLEFGNPSRGNGVQTGWMNHPRMHFGSRRRIKAQAQFPGHGDFQAETSEGRVHPTAASVPYELPEQTW